MVEINKTHVSFQARSGEASDVEREVIQKVAEVIGPDFSAERILNAIRSAKLACSNDSNFISEIINNLIDVDQPENEVESDVLEADRAVKVDKPVEKANQTADPMEVTDVIPYNVPNSNHSVKLDAEDSDLQRALQESLKVSQTNFTTYLSSIPEDLEEMIRNPNLSTGLHNAGNTCWFNCVAQILYHIPKFRSLIYHCVPYNWQCKEPSVITPETVMTRDLLMRMRRLFAEMQFSTVSYIDTSYVLEVVDALTKKSSGQAIVIGEQQDATESLIRIIDWLEHGIKQALEDRLNPNISVGDEGTNEDSYIPAGSTIGAPNSDVAGISPPSYVQFEGTSKDVFNGESSSAPIAPESRPNSPVKTNENGIPIRRSLFGASASTAKSLNDEPMDISDGTAIRPSGDTKDEFSAPHPPSPKEVTNPDSADTKIEVTEEEKQTVEMFNEMMENIFTSKCLVSTVSEGMRDFISQREIRNSPQFFHLQVSYGDLHDALEACTFDNGRGESSHVQNWFDTLPAAIFMGLSRFGYNNGMPEKLHNRFYFPKTLYMDRYLKKNSERVLKLREQRNNCRKLLAETKALYRGLREYPSADNQTVNVVSAINTVISVLKNETRSESVSDVPFIGPLAPVHFPSSSFVENLGKIFPNIDHSQFSNVAECIDTLSNISNCLHASEIELEQKEMQLMAEIETIYDEASLQNCEYKLHSVIIHSGEANRGHYWTYSRSQFVIEEEQWERLNDKTIENVSWEQVESDAFGNGSPSAPSAYCLLYIRSDATWLMEPDSLTREQALSALPDDLREMVDIKADDFATNLKRFREDREAQKNASTFNETISNRWPTTSSNEAEKNKRNWQDGTVFEDDENANPTDAASSMNLASSLNKQISLMSEQTTNIVKHSMQKMFRTIQTSMPNVYYDENALLCHQLTQMMETDGFSFLTEILGYNVKDMELHAENDADKAYDTFLLRFYDHFGDLKQKEKFDTNLPLFILKNVPNVHKFLKRYLLVKALSISNIKLISKKAQLELSEFRSNASCYAKAVLLSHWSAVIYELIGITAWACKNCYQLIGGSENERNEIRFPALMSARMARYCYNQFVGELINAAASNLDIEEIFDFELIQVATVLSLLHSCLPLMRALLDDRIMLNTMSFLMERSDRRVAPSECVREISYALSALRIWVNNSRRLERISYKPNKNAYEVLKMYFDIAKSSKSVSVNCEKIEMMTIIDNSLTKDRLLEETLPDNIQCANKGFSAEMKQIVQQIDSLTNFEDIYRGLMEKLQSIVLQH